MNSIRDRVTASQSLYSRIVVLIRIQCVRDFTDRMQRTGRSATSRSAVGAIRGSPRGQDPEAHASHMGTVVRQLYLESERVLPRMDRLLRDLQRDDGSRPHAPQHGCSSPTVIARSPATAVEAQALHCSSPDPNGAQSATAWGVVYGGRKSFWALSHSGVVDFTVSKSYFVQR